MDDGVNMEQSGVWLSILEYATVKKSSISTIRRAIKAGRVKYREENGKYFIFTKSETTSDHHNVLLEVENLKKINRNLVEENNDLKMLLTVYENTTTNRESSLPAIPEIEQ
jgi:hypothetical protein